MRAWILAYINDLDPMLLIRAGEMRVLLKHSFIHVVSTIIFWPCQLGQQNSLTASLQRDKTLPYKWPGYDTKQSDGEAPII